MVAGKFDARLEMLARVSEREFQETVINDAQLGGWKHFHAYSSKRSPAGWPDLALLRPPDLIFAELKDMVRRVTPNQDVWLTGLAQVETVETYVWRPSDMARIRARLLRAPR